MRTKSEHQGRINSSECARHGAGQRLQVKHRSRSRLSAQALDFRSVKSLLNGRISKISCRLARAGEKFGVTHPSMSLISIFLLALALAADSFAASIAKGARSHRPTLRQALVVGALFGSVQTLLPLAGWQIGIEFRPVVEAFDHWVAFGILSAIGTKLIYEGIRSEGAVADMGAYTIPALVLTAIATSIDSFVVGFGFGFLNISILVALAMIGGVTFLISVGGVYLGRKFGEHFGEYVEIVAGVVLIGIGLKILIDHLG